MYFIYVSFVYRFVFVGVGPWEIDFGGRTYWLSPGRCRQPIVSHAETSYLWYLQIAYFFFSFGLIFLATRQIKIHLHNISFPFSTFNTQSNLFLIYEIYFTSLSKKVSQKTIKNSPLKKKKTETITKQLYFYLSTFYELIICDHMIDYKQLFFPMF